MNKRIVIALFALGLAASGQAEPAVMYKFTDTDGHTQYSYSLPPDQAQRGYEKIDARTHQVLESVAPQLPPDELAEQRRREQAMAACRDELERIYTLYASERDIDHAREEALDALERRIAQVQGNLAQARREHERLSGQAADAERAGRQIPQSLIDKIERSASQIRNLETEIEQRRDEQDLARERYRRELARFRDGSCPDPEPSITQAAP